MRAADFIAQMPSLKLELPTYPQPAPWAGRGLSDATLLAAREAQILGWVREEQHLPIEWCEIVSIAGGKRAVIRVAGDALSFGAPDDFVRVNVNHTTAQQIADALLCTLPTSKIADLAFQQASKARACTGMQGSDMATKAKMLLHSRKVDAQLKASTDKGAIGGLFRTVGKDWVNTNGLMGKPDRAANYGWHDPAALYTSPTGLKLWQPVGLAHNRFHVDYSQILCLVHRTVTVDGQDLDFDSVAADPSLCALVSAEGPLRVRRHPGVSPFGSTMETVPPLPSGPDTITFVQAKNYRAANRASMNWIVLHTMEAAEKPTTAKAVASWFAGASAPMASAHYCVDSQTIIQCVREEDIAFAAPGANELGVHIEQAGYARQSVEDWADPFSAAMLLNSAQVAAAACARWDIPPVFVDAAGLKAGQRGITTHAEVSKAWRRTDHTDPGPNFPMADYIGMVKAAILVP